VTFNFLPGCSPICRSCQLCKCHPPRDRFINCCVYFSTICISNS